MKPHLQQARSLAGFTLLDALIGLVVLAVGMLALIHFHATSLLNSADAKARTEATTLAEEKVQELKTFYSGGKFDTLKDPTAAELTQDANDIATSGMELVEDFTRSWTVGKTVGGVYSPGEYIGSYKCELGNGTIETRCSTVPCTCSDGSSGPPCPCPDPSTGGQQCEDIDSSATDYCHQKRVEVTVSWKDAKGVSQQISLETIIERADFVGSGEALRP